MPSRERRVDRGLHFLQRLGLDKGVLGSSRGWFWVFVVTFGLRRLRRTIGSEYETVWRGEVRPGEVLQIGHLTETYQGRGVRSRRRKISS
ncbi:MAG TPA: hypothetical protein VJM49_05905 [Acidimicrobiales bacterium]|nr:hypothetical protein [Acidimicrobiales bacterium]